jgi:prevent-host-death family protein
MIIMVMEVIHMVSNVSAVKFRQNLGEMLNQVEYRNDAIVINKDGKAVAALVDADLFARIRRMQERFDALSQRIAEAYAGVPLEQGLKEIDAAVKRGRRR